MKKIFLISALFSGLILPGWILFAEAPLCTTTEVESEYADSMFMNYLSDNETIVFAVGWEAETSDRRKYFFVKNWVKDTKYDFIYDLMYQSDKKNFIYVAEKEGKFFVVENGVEWKKYNSINWMMYSSNGEFYAFTTEVEGKTIVVHNGIESNAYDYVEEIELSKDGKHLAFSAQKDKKYYLVQDGKEWEPFHYISSLSYRENGSLFYLMMRSREDGFITMLDGKELEWFEGYATAPDGSSSAYLKQKENKKYVIVKDGVEGEEYDYIRNIEFSKDGKSFYYFIKKNDKEVLVLDGVEGNPYDDIGGLMFSDDGKNYLYTAKKGEKSLLVVNGEESEEYDSIETYKFYSPLGYNSRYIGERDGKRFLIRDGEEVDMDDLENAPAHTPPTVGYSFIGIKDKKYIFVRDGKIYGTYDALSKSEYAYQKEEKNYVFHDSKSGKSLFLRDEKKAYEYDYIQSAYVTPDNKSYFLIVSESNNKRTFSLDGNIPYSFIKDDKNWGVYEKIYHVDYSPDFKKLTLAVKKNGKDLLITEMCGESEPNWETSSGTEETNSTGSGEIQMGSVMSGSCALDGQTVDCEKMIEWVTQVVKKWLDILKYIFVVVWLLGVFSLWMLIHALINPISHKTLWILCIFFFFPIGAFIYFFVVKRNYMKNPIIQQVNNQTLPASTLATSPAAFFPDPNPGIIGAYTPPVVSPSLPLQAETQVHMPEVPAPVEVPVIPWAPEILPVISGAPLVSPNLPEATTPTPIP